MFEVTLNSVSTVLFLLASRMSTWVISSSSIPRGTANIISGSSILPDSSVIEAPILRWVNLGDHLRGGGTRGKPGGSLAGERRGGKLQ